MALWNHIIVLLTCSLCLAFAKVSMDKASAALGVIDKGLDVVNKGIDVAQKYDKILTDKLDSHFNAVAKRPEPFIKPGDLSAIAKNMKDGGKITFEETGGFDGVQQYKPPSWNVEVAQTKEVKQDDGGKEGVFAYPMGIGNLMMSGCFGKNYVKGDPCYKNIQPVDRCVNQIDSANFIGVGFDITKSYSSESRKKSVVQRVCNNKAAFMGADVPDNMNAFGVYDYSVNTRSFQSVDSYRSYLAEKAGTKMSTGVFRQISKKYQHTSSVGSAGLFHNVGVSHGRGGASTQKFGNKFSSSLQNQAKSQSAGMSKGYFAVLEADVKLYEIALDHSSTSDLSATFLDDFNNLPTSYYLIGADVKLQDFVLRYGTHYIKSAKFGGKFNVFKKSTADSKQTQQQFAKTAESEFSAMMSTMQSRYSQTQVSVNFFGTGGKHSSKSQSSEATKNENSGGTKQTSQAGSAGGTRSEFIETTVEALGGSPEIAASIMEFYTPAFKGRFIKWLTSIPDYPKPYDMTFGRLPELFDVSPDSLFKVGNANAGCFGATKTEKDADGKVRRYFIRDRTTKDNRNATTTVKEKVFCKYGSKGEFLKDFKAKRLALERAITIFIAEGPFATSAFDIPAGHTGCETETIRYASDNHNPFTSWPTSWEQMKSKQFKIIFQLPNSLEGILDAHEEFEVKWYGGFWYTKMPGDQFTYTMENMCPSPSGLNPNNRLCVAGINLVYDPNTGFLKFDAEHYKPLLTFEANFTKSLGDHYIARAESMNVMQSLKVNKLGEVPCGVKWSNSHRIDPNQNTSCIHFSAASRGDIFVVFAAIPNDHTTWFYLQLSPKGAAFYRAMVLEKSDTTRSSGTLGDDRLFETFFVCVNQGNNENVRLTYGKAPSQREVGTVHGTFMFPLTKKERVSFYTFAAGEHKVTIDDVRVVKDRPAQVQCGGDGSLVQVKGQCVLDCDPQCLVSQCHQSKDPRSCTGKCRNVKHFYKARDTICLSKCPPGYEVKEVKGEKVCTKCALGYYKNIEGNGACSPCAPGTYAGTTGMRECSRCGTGHYQSVQGKSSCTPCPLGSHQSRTGQTRCGNCPAKTFASQTGQVRCTPCTAGHFQDKVGQRSCRPCPAGSSAANPGALTCDKCRTGTYQSRQGMSACVPCEQGHKCPVIGLSASVACPANTYNNERGQTTCKPCTGGKKSAPGSASCGNTCAKGTFLNTRAQRCQACAVGSYAPAAGQSSCRRCDAGYTSNREKTQCIDVNECASGACKNGGVCTNTKGSFTCRCTEKFQGKDCNTDVNECLRSPCKNNARCVNTRGSYTCVCPNRHYTGTNCQIANGNWGAFTSFGRCNPSTGRHSKSRQCNNPAPANGGRTCAGDSVFSANCKVNGGYGRWSAYGRCNFAGKKRRTRQCDSPKPLHGGAPCQGASVEDSDCPVNGRWGAWGPYGNCVNGRQQRYRKCDNPKPKNNGAACAGSSVETKAGCKIAGNWGAWGHWTCSQRGTSTRSRRCDNPPPVNSPTCPGVGTEKKPCDMVIPWKANSGHQGPGTYRHHNANLAIDGNRASFSYANDGYTWWKAELQQAAIISEIRLFLPAYAISTGMMMSRRNVVTRLTNTDPWIVCANIHIERHNPQKAPLRPYVVRCGVPRMAKFISLNTHGSSSRKDTQLDEVEVVGQFWRCPEVNIDYSGNDDGSVEQQATWQACARQCAARAGCKGWSWDLGTKRCYFKNANWQSGWRKKNGVISGYRDCTQDSCLLVDTHFSGADLAYTKENSKEKCSDNCDKNPQCSAWSYVVREGVHKGNCHLKGANYDNQKGRVRDVGVVAMLKSCRNKGQQAGKNPSARADFHQSGLGRVGTVEGTLLANGNFIFLWRNDGFFKMVLTNNQGAGIKAGYVRDPGSTWMNPATWNNGAYSITNFIAGKIPDVTCKYLQDTYFTNGDVVHHSVEPTRQKCEERCTKNSKCAAWAFVHRAAGRGTCHLKNSDFLQAQRRDVGVVARAKNCAVPR